MVHLDVSTLQMPMLHLVVSTPQGPELHLHLDVFGHQQEPFVRVSFEDIRNSVHEKNHEIPRHRISRGIPKYKNIRISVSTEFLGHPTPHALWQNRGPGHSYIRVVYIKMSLQLMRQEFFYSKLLAAGSRK
jgi:hypothetical protein